ncbi:MAG TPA: phage holin family protein [Clostridia bacterium]
MADDMNTTKTGNFSITHFIVRLVVGAVVLAITAALTPGFAISSLWSLLLGAVVLAGLDYMASRFLGANASAFGKGITGFIMAAVIIYITQFFVSGYAVTLWGAIIGALIYGVVDAIIPGKSALSS